jgi:predicted RNase H-like HicB family nuclease
MKLQIRILPDGKGGFAAQCQCLPGCVAQGKTPEEATTRLLDSIRGYIAAVSNFVPEHLDYEVQRV